MCCRMQSVLVNWITLNILRFPSTASPGFRASRFDRSLSSVHLSIWLPSPCQTLNFGPPWPVMGVYSEIPSRNSVVQSVRNRRRHFWYQCRRRPNSGYWTRRIPADQNHRRQYTSHLLWQLLGVVGNVHTDHTGHRNHNNTAQWRHRLTAPVLLRGWLLSTRDGRGGARHSDSSRLRWHTTD